MDGQKSMNKKIKFKIKVLSVIFGSALCSQVLGLEHFNWQPDQCNRECPGSWVITERPPLAFYRPQITVAVAKQRFDFKKKLMSGDDLEIVGKSLWIRAKKTQFEYESSSMRWALKGPVLAWINDLYLEGESAIYDQKREYFEAKNIEFFFQKYNFYGTACSISRQNNFIEIVDLKTSQCPPSHQSWSFRISSMTYDTQADTLVLYKPGLFIYDYEILHIDHFAFDGLRAKNRLENIPRLHIETNSGIALQFPMVWTKKEETLALVPEVNTKQGIGMGVAISKDKVHAKGFVQLMPFQKSEESSWMGSITSKQRNSNFSYGYRGALVSDPAFCYRYPGVVDFWEDLYLVNDGWISKETEFGKITLSTEKLYRSQEARENDYEVIEYLGRADWSHNGNIRVNAGADVIHRYNDQTYQRIRWQSEYDLGAQRGFELRLSAYPFDSTYAGALVWATKTYPYRTAVGQWELFFAGSFANEQAVPLLLDTIAQPIGPDFLMNGQWHTGLDWTSSGTWVTPKWTIDLTSRLQAALSIAYALKHPSQPWDAPAQPYLTPFRENDRFSPMSMRIMNERWNGELLWDLLRGECVMAQWGRSLAFEESVVELLIFYHEYYPMDRLSQTVQSVAQFGYQYHSNVEGPWQLDFNVRWDLIPIKISSAGISLVYDDCCWEFSLKAGADRQYDPNTSLVEWHYNLGVGLEIYALGMLDNTKNPWMASERPSRPFVSKNHY
jgi:hypothetical protein